MAMDLQICNLAGPLCVIQAREEWRLQDLHEAVAVSTGIPADEQRLVAGATLLAGQLNLLVQLLPEDARDVLCVRCLDWVVIPYYSGEGLREAPPKASCFTIEEAKLKCTGDSDLWGFTFLGSKDAGGRKTTPEGFKRVGTRLGVRNRTGTTYVRLTPAGREVLLDAIRQKRGGAKRWLLEPIRDLEIILAAVEHDAAAFRYVSEELRCNIQVAEIAVEANPFALQFAPELVRADHTIVRNAVKKNGFALQYASDELKSDREVVLLAIKRDPSSLRYASETLRADHSICLTAVQKSGDTLQYVDAALQNSRDIVITAIQRTGEALMYASKTLRSDPEVVAIAVSQNPEAAEYALPAAGHSFP